MHGGSGDKRSMKVVELDDILVNWTTAIAIPFCLSTSIGFTNRHVYFDVFFGFAIRTLVVDYFHLMSTVQ